MNKTESEKYYAKKNHEIISKLNELVAKGIKCYEIKKFIKEMQEDFSKEGFYGICSEEVYYLFIDFYNNITGGKK